jgi:peptide deformylase
MATTDATYPTHPSLVLYPHPTLRAVAAPVTSFDDRLRQFVEGMFAVMYDQSGVGLAAPQVGVAKRIFVTDDRTDKGESVNPQVWINPTIQPLGGRRSGEEGCLSLPALYGEVERHSAITVRWQDLAGETRVRDLDAEAGDFLAIIIQHELDHLDGILFLDHLSPARLNLLRRKLKDLERTYKKATGKAGAVLRR